MNLKIVFLPLLAFEMIILIDNFRYFLLLSLWLSLFTCYTALDSVFYILSGDILIIF